MPATRLLASSLARQCISRTQGQQRLLSTLGTAASNPQLAGELHADAQPSCSGEAASSSAPIMLLQRQPRNLLPGGSSVNDQLSMSPCDQRRTFLGQSSGAATKKYSQRRLVGWTPEQLYSVISHVEDYHKFVPWCQKSRILSIEPDKYLEAELEVGFQVLKERYTSKVTLQRPSLVTSYVADSSLFHHLNNHWRMERGPTAQSCWLSFDVDFAFRSSLYTHLADMFFSEVVKRMSGAFESRCAVLYGPSSFVRPAQQHQHDSKTK